MATIIKRKIKKNIIIYFCAGIVTIFVITILAINYKNDYKYKQTTEYKLLEKGYTKEEVNDILNGLQEKDLLILLEKEKNEYLLPIMKEKYYISKNLEEYLNFYKENKDKSTYDIVAMVNVHANKDWYEEIEPANTELKNLLLVNKHYQLEETYIPENLIEVSNWYCYGENQIIKDAYESFIEMYNKAKEEEITLIINSSYRNYESQKNTYNRLKNTFGTTKADSQAARPGHSEHETGLAFDIFAPGNASTEDFKESNAYLWLKEHAYQYGFIERYPQDKEYLTGYAFESWHWRYVGIEVATKIYEEQITFDEYYAYYIENQKE